MPFQIDALPPDAFAAYFAMTDAELTRHMARRMRVTAHPGTPCRVSLQDAGLGETVILVNHMHQPAATPYQSSHAIFVREGAQQARPAPDVVPEVLRRRLISVRWFDESDMMLDAGVTPGTDLDAAITQAFTNPAVAYLHLHFAKPGCYAARVRRV